MKKLKIVSIGGGSSYTPELIDGFIKRKDELNIKEIWLLDIEEGKEKLNIVGAMAQRMVKAAGLDWEVNLTLDRKEALKDADFVSTQFRVGLLNARIRDERIPLKYGMIGQETNGAGGILKAFRTIPVILDIIEDMKVLCPNAWLINFTNPSGIITETAIKFGGWKRTIGLCNVPIGHMSSCNQVTGLPEFSDELYYKFAGLNHFHWHRVWNKLGQEITSELIDKLYHPTDRVQTDDMKNIHQVPFNYDLIKSQKLLPCGYHRYYYLTKEMLEEQLVSYSENKTRGELVKETETRLFELYKDPNLNYKPKELSERGGAHYSDAACETISSIVNDKRTTIVVSTENNGAITDLPNDSIVEVSAQITSHGAEAINWGSFESGPRGLLQIQKAMEECVIDAAINGDYAKAIEAFTINPLVESGPKAIEMLNEMLIANKEYLPQFKDKIDELENSNL